jgi:hypothetical protein
MREIVPGLLWLGNMADARDLDRLDDEGIAALVDLAVEELPPQLPRETIYCRFPLLDGAGNPRELLRAAICATVSLLRSRVPTLVCCGSGMSRSPAVVAAALAMVRGGQPGDSLEEVVSGCPHDVSPLLWKDIMGVFDGLDTH